MLIRFSVNNFLSFAEKQTLDLTAVNTCKERLDDNCFSVCGKTLLKSAVIYGANASGKSNLIKALNFFCFFILTSSKDLTSSEYIQVKPFLLNQKNRKQPSEFEIEFFLNQTVIRYGFYVTEKMIVREWLYQQDKVVFMRVFDKRNDIIQVENLWEKAHGLEERTRKNALFLSVCAQFAVPEAEKIITWFANKMQVLSADNPNRFMNYTTRQIYSGRYRNDILDFLRNADMSITDLSVSEINKEKQRLFGIHTFDIKSYHNVYDEFGNIVDKTVLNLELSESLGTKKAFALAGPIIDTLRNGHVLIVDELDSRLHPVFTRKIVQLFNSAKTNPLNAQLIFNTHDTNLLSCKVYDVKSSKDLSLLRRDQIYFTEKDNKEATHLYSLLEFKKKDSKKVHNYASFEKDYLNGLYGAIPFVGNLISLITTEE